MEFTDPALWGKTDYSDIPEYTRDEYSVRDKLVARVPSNFNITNNKRMIQFKTDNDPNINLWFRSSGHSPRGRISWRHVQNYSKELHEIKFVGPVVYFD